MKNFDIRYLVLVVLLIIRADFVFAKKSIKELTSSKTSKKVENKIPNSGSTPPKSRVSHGLKGHSIGVGLGQTMLISEFKDNGDDAITADLYYGYKASHSFDMFANFHYSKHEFKNRYAIVSGLNAGIKARLYQFDSFSPFVLGGLGFYRPKVKRDIEGEVVTSESKLTFGYNFGAGADLELNDRISIGALIHYHNPFDVRQETGTDVKGSYFKLLFIGYYTFY